MDVGGSSTELITAREQHISWLTSVPIGSGWLHDIYLSSNPPSQDEVKEVEDFLNTYIPGLHVPEAPTSLVVTGSSAKALLKLATQALKLDPQSNRLTSKDLQGCCGLLLSLPAEEELGQLHDSDVLIALLRLCLGNQEGAVDTQALSSSSKTQGKARSLLRPELVADLLDPAVAPSAEQHYGLEHMLRKQEQTREQQYRAFRRHWYHLQEQDFRRHVLAYWIRKWWVLDGGENTVDSDEHTHKPNKSTC